MKKESKQGGPRKGAGRKQVPWKSKTLKVPEPLLPKVKHLIAQFKKTWKKP